MVANVKAKYCSGNLFSGLFHHCRHSHDFDSGSWLYFSCRVLSVPCTWLPHIYPLLPYLQIISHIALYRKISVLLKLPLLDLNRCDLFNLSKVITLISLIHYFRLHGSLWDSCFAQPTERNHIKLVLILL